MNSRTLISFIDASGTFAQKDRFFGVGMFTLRNTGEITDKLHIIYQRVLAISQMNRDKTLHAFINNGDY